MKVIYIQQEDYSGSAEDYRYREVMIDDEDAYRYYGHITDTDTRVEIDKAHVCKFERNYFANLPWWRFI